eukprot:scaffold11680_cov142-Cylindrotheca_fusiformis.AAC.4
MPQKVYFAFIAFILVACDAFLHTYERKRKPFQELQMIGNFLSGMTGQSPSSLDPPLHILENSNIDPNKQNVDLQCVYKASRDGWSALDFHNACDGRGSGLVVVLTNSGKKFGGYNPLGWQSSDDYGTSNAAFLWFEKGGKGVKCPILPGGNAAVFDFATGGPQFGSSDLIIGPPNAAVMGGFAGPDMEDTSINAGSLKTGSSAFCSSYEDVSGWPRGSHRFVEVEVYCNANIDQKSNTGGGFSLWPF